MERFNMQQEQEVIPQIKIVYVGCLGIGQEGPHQIKSTLAETEIGSYLESLQDYVVEVEGRERMTAVCIDGRPARCLASDVMPVLGVSGRSVSMPEQQRTPVRPHVAGGLYDMATMMAVLSNWSGFPKDVRNFDQAHKIVGSLLDDLGYKDAAHTTDVSFSSTETTECGAWMKKKAAMDNGAKISQESLYNHVASPSDEAISALNGYDDPRHLMSNEHYQNVRRTQQRLVSKDFFNDYNPVDRRNEMVKNNPYGMEVLKSDSEHPTHGHNEIMVVSNELPGTTVHRDALNERDGCAPFVDDRWMRLELADIMSSSPEERERLVLASDVVTVDVSHELVAPGMPVAVIMPNS